jgi:hypothetical protein
MAGWNNVLMFMIFWCGSNPYDAYLGEVAQPLNTSGVLVTRKRKRWRPCRCWRVWPALIRGGFKALDIAGSCWGEHERWVRWFMLVSGCFQHFSIGHPVSAVIWTLAFPKICSGCRFVLSCQAHPEPSKPFGRRRIWSSAASNAWFPFLGRGLYLKLQRV